MHYKPILNALVKILALDHDLTQQRDLIVIERRPTIIQMEQNEERTDIVFQMLLLMIDVFYQTYPDYSKLLEDYLEEEFNDSKVFFALTKQVTQIGQAFEEDFKDLDRTWLVQTLSYFHLILKMLRISFVKHMEIKEQEEELEKAKREKLEALKKGTLIGDKQNHNISGSIIMEEDSERNSTEYHNSAHFGDNEIQMTYQSDSPFNTGAAKPSIPRLPEVVEEVNESRETNSTGLYLSPLRQNADNQSLEMTAIHSTYPSNDSVALNET